MSHVSDIIEDLKAAIRKISQADGYTNSIREAQVPSKSSYWSDQAEDAYPCFTVVLNSEKREKQPGLLKKILNVDIVCEFQQPVDGEVEGWLSDVERAICADTTRSANAVETWVPSVQRNSDVLEEIQVYVMNVEIWTLVEFGEM